MSRLTVSGIAHCSDSARSWSGLRTELWAESDFIAHLTQLVMIAGDKETEFQRDLSWWCLNSETWMSRYIHYCSGLFTFHKVGLNADKVKSGHTFPCKVESWNKAIRALSCVSSSEGGVKFKFQYLLVTRWLCSLSLSLAAHHTNVIITSFPLATSDTSRGRRNTIHIRWPGSPRALHWPSFLTHFLTSQMYIAFEENQLFYAQKLRHCTSALFLIFLY